MPLDLETYEAQAALSRICRSGEPQSIPGAGPERLQVYRDLVYGGIEGALRKAYPISCSLLGEDLWAEMASDFVAQHPISSPCLWSMPRELAVWAASSGWGDGRGLPFLPDLLMFEWIEIEVFMMEDSRLPPFSAAGDLMKDLLLLNPDRRILQLTYPVFRPSLTEDISRPGSYLVLCYRHPETFAAHYVQLDPFHEKLFCLIGERLPAEQALFRLSEQCGLPYASALEHGEVFLRRMLREGMILGYLSGNTLESLIGSG